MYIRYITVHIPVISKLLHSLFHINISGTWNKIYITDICFWGVGGWGEQILEYPIPLEMDTPAFIKHYSTIA